MKRILSIVAFVCLALPVQAQILVKQSTATTVNGKLTKIADGTDHTGLTVTSITAKIIKHSDTTSSTVTAVTCAASGSANDCVEVAAGVYNMELSSGNTDTLGRLDVCMLASGDYTDCTRYEVVPSGYYDFAVTTGPSTAPTNFSSMSIDGSGRIDLGKILGTSVSTPATAGILDVNIKNIDNDAAAASGTVTFPPGTLASGLGSGTAQAGGTSTQIILAAAENYAVNDHLIGALVTLLSGTGKGQSRVITAYTNSTDTATVDSAWITNPDATSVYAVIPFPTLQTATTIATAVWASGTRTLSAGAITTGTFASGAIDAAAIAADAIGASEIAASAIGAAEIADAAIDRATFAVDTGHVSIRSNTATAGAAGTITLDASASAVDDFYNNATILLTGGTGAGQTRAVQDYTGSSKVVTVNSNWATNPDNTTTFALLPMGLSPAVSGLTAGDVWAYATRDLSAGAITTATFAAGAIDAAAIAANAIGASEIAADAIGASEIATDAIGAAELAANAITSAELATGAITNATFAAGAIDAAAIATDAIGDAEIATGAIASTAFAAGAIDAAAIAADAIGASEIATDAIGAAELAANAIGASEVATDAIGAAELADAAIDRATFAVDTGLMSIRSNTAQAGAAGTITLDASASAVNDFYNNATIVITGGTGVGQTRAISGYAGATKIATINTNWASNPDSSSTFALLPLGLSPAVTGLTAGDVWSFGTRDLTAGAITSATFAAAAITAASIATDAIGADELADNAIDAGVLATNTITAAKIASDAITSAKIADDSIGASEIASSAIGATEIATGAITTVAFAAGAIDAAAIATDAIGAAELAANSITSSELADGAIDAATLATDTITASKIAGDAITAAKIANDAIGATEIAAGAIDSATFAAETGKVPLRSGTAQAGAAGTITLDSGASAVDDTYNNATIVITGGNGAGQTRAISDYVGSTKVATVNNNWATNPDSSSTFALLPMGLSPAVAGLTSADIWSYATRDLTASAITSTTFAAGAITASAVAADAIGASELAADAVTEIKTATQTGLFYLKTATATTGDRIHFIPFASNGSPTKSATGVTCQISLDGSAPALIADTPTEVEFTRGAYWKFDLNLAETSGKAAVIMCIGSGMVDTPIVVEFQN